LLVVINIKPPGLHRLSGGDNGGMSLTLHDMRQGGGRGGRPGHHFTSSHFMAAELSSLVPQRGFGRAVRSLHPPPAAASPARRRRYCGLSARPRLVAGRRSAATAAAAPSNAALAAAAPTTIAGLTVRLTQAVLLVLVAFVRGRG
jgi:hypothetical protein